MKSASSSSPSPSFPMVVVFGRPGAGKSTVAQCSVQKATRHIHNKKLPQLNTAAVDGVVVATIGIDLDVYVPQWMKDNFAAGIYPNLQQRQDFAHATCKSLQEDLLKHHHHHHQQQQQQLELQKSPISAAVTTGTIRSTESESDTSPLRIMVHEVAAIVSFSFVNNDLRDVFRRQFPQASWVLLDTTEREAEKRIRERTGHFYTGPPDEMTTSTTTKQQPCETGKSTASDADNADWKFDPVTFPHVILNGMDPIDMNAEIVFQTLFTTTVDEMSNSRSSSGIETFT